MLSVVYLYACSVHYPVVMKINSEIYIGEAIASIGTTGTYIVKTTEGAKCHGEFENSSSSLSSPATITCSDDRKGKLTIIRNPDRRSGFGQGKLEDGTKVRFAYGPTATKLILE